MFLLMFDSQTEMYRVFQKKKPFPNFGSLWLLKVMVDWLKSISGYRVICSSVYHPNLVQKDIWQLFLEKAAAQSKYHVTEY